MPLDEKWENSTQALGLVATASFLSLFPSAGCFLFYLISPLPDSLSQGILYFSGDPVLLLEKEGSLYLDKDGDYKQNAQQRALCEPMD